MFDEALERYNAKQTRSDRKIADYYEKIRASKQEKLFHEVIFQIGNKDDMNARSQNGELAKEILDEYMKEFQISEDQLYLHDDEQCPCGSGKTYKDCCKGKNDGEPVNPKKPVEVLVMEGMRKGLKQDKRLFALESLELSNRRLSQRRLM